MRLTVMLTALVSIASPAVAQDAECAALGKLAGDVMWHRHVKNDLNAAIAKSKTISDNPARQSLARYLVIQAYDSPRFQTKSVQEDSIADFGNEIQIECLTGRIFGKY